MTDMRMQLLIEAEAGDALRALAETRAQLQQMGEAGRTAGAGARVAAADYAALRASVDPLFAASQRYEAALRTLDAAQKAGVITDKERARTLELVEARLQGLVNAARRGDGPLPLVADMRALGDAAGVATAQTANLGYQLNDVMMMAAIGQSPFTLMLQQGPQVVQVMNQIRASGQSIGPAVGAAIRSLLNPMSLLTMAVIAGTAALVQWGMSLAASGPDLDRAAEDVERLTGLIKDYRAAIDRASAGRLELAADFGAATAQARELLALQVELRRITAERASWQTSQTIATIFGADLLKYLRNPQDYFDTSIIPPETIRMDARRAIAEALGIAGEDAEIVAPVEKIAGALDALSQAQGPREQATAMADLRQALAEATGGVSAMKEEVFALYAQLLDAEQAALMLAAATERPQTAVQPDWSERASVAANQARVQAMRAVTEAEAEAARAAEARRARDTATAEAMLKDLKDEIALRSLIVRYGEDSAGVAALRAQQEREAFEEIVAGLDVTQDLKDALIAAWEASQRLAAVDVAGGIGAGADEAARLAANLNAAAAAMSGIASAAAREAVSNIGRRARLEALQTGQSAAEAAVAGRLAEERAALAPALGSGEGAIRAAAQQQLAALERDLREGVVLGAQIAELEAALRNNGRSSGGGRIVAETNEAARALQDLDLTLRGIEEKARAGLVTTEEAAREMAAARRRTAEGLAELIPRLEALGPAGAQGAEQARAALAGLAEEIGAVAEAGSRGLAGSLSGILADLAVGARSTADAFSAMARAIQSELAKLLQERVFAPVFGPLFDAILPAFGLARGGVLSGGALQPFARGGVPALPAVRLDQPMRQVAPFARGGVPPTPVLQDRMIERPAAQIVPALSVLRNTVVDRPVLFPMERGKVGLMGEAGPEAILPLKGGGVRAIAPAGETILPLARAASGHLAVRLDQPAGQVVPFAIGGVPEVPAMPTLSILRETIIERPVAQVIPFATGGMPEVRLDVPAAQVIPFARGGVPDWARVPGPPPAAPRDMATAGAGGGAPPRPLRVEIVNHGAARGEEVSVTQEQEADGDLLRIVIDRVDAALAENARRGRGSLTAALGGVFGMRRVPR